MTEKAPLRAVMRARRKDALAANPDAPRAAARHAGEMLDALFATTGTFRDEQARRAFTVALYRAVGSELDARPLADVLLTLGVTLALPVVVDRAGPMVFRRWTPGDPLEPDLSGSPAPLPLAAEVQPDLIVTPLLAFDRTGARLGQGGGYYDRTFAARPDAARVGLAHDAQEQDRLPLEAHDQRLHGILTETGYRAARKDF